MLLRDNRCSEVSIQGNAFRCVQTFPQRGFSEEADRRNGDVQDEQDAYPRLTEITAWRVGRTWKEWTSSGARYSEEGADGAEGGYYTKEELREIVQYAAQRHIVVIPEIEMPIHSEEVLAAYPELGCSGELYKDSDFCVGNDAVFDFLETVLAEVMDVFPSEHIHIGGDEAGKQHWKTCPKCQERMRQEGFTDVDELQSYMIRRIERFVNSKGCRIIGWDEILDGGLAPDATVMSWRGTEGGIKAMEMGHDVIMTPGRYCYLDHAQDRRSRNRNPSAAIFRWIRSMSTNLWSCRCRRTDCTI